MLQVSDVYRVESFEAYPEINRQPCLSQLRIVNITPRIADESQSHELIEQLSRQKELRRALPVDDVDKAPPAHRGAPYFAGRVRLGALSTGERRAPRSQCEVRARRDSFVERPLPRFLGLPRCCSVLRFRH